MSDTDQLPTKLLWVDLEMTGLDPGQHTIVEIAAEITDFNFKTLASYEAVIAQSEQALEQMNDWVRNQHTANGLLERIRTVGRSEEEVKHELVGFIKAQFGNESAVLAGNSIHSDRAFIKKHWPEVDQLLHYRMLDVSSFKVLMQGRFKVLYEKPENHRAFEDIQASIAELQYYLEWLKNRQQSPAR